MVGSAYMGCGWCGLWRRSGPGLVQAWARGQRKGRGRGKAIESTKDQAAVSNDSNDNRRASLLPPQKKEKKKPR